MSRFVELVQLMQRLRGPDGCPWDREQSLDSLRTFLVEETYEVLDALDGGRAEEHQEELGDLLLQILFQAELRRERGEFDIEAVIAGIHDKLVRRHPHVFGDRKAASAAEVLDQWEQLKAREKEGTDRPSLLDHVPAQLPALLRALRLSEKTARVGFDWAADDDLRAKLLEEIAELDAAIAGGRRDAVAEEVGDLLFVMANWARRLGIDPEEALRRANRKFERRFRSVEQAVVSSQRRLADVGLAEMDRLWDEAKRREREPGA